LINSLLAALALTACATSPLPQSFPAEAQSIQAPALKDRVSGRTYTGRMTSGVGWEMKYAADGRFNMRTSNGETDQGRWRTEDNRLCVDFEGKFPSGCSEVRTDAKRLYLKRASTGEVVALEAAP